MTERQRVIKEAASKERSVSQERAFERGATWADLQCAVALRDTLKAHFGDSEMDKLEMEDIMTQWEERLGL